MNIEENMQAVVDLVNEDRPFTRGERESIKADMAQVLRLLQAHERLVDMTLWAACATGFLLGFICAQVFL